MSTPRLRLAAASLTALAVTAACTSNEHRATPSTSASRAPSTVVPGSSAKTPAPDYGDTIQITSTKRGGTIYYADGPRFVEHWDPQRSYIARDIADESRLFVRTLVQYGFGPTARSNALHPDLATDLGRSSDGNRTWRFTLKSGVTWQDGSPVTCADVKYGVSRTFATDTITGGPTYAIQYLDIPTVADGSSAYQGPYKGVGQQYYDRAVTCSGQTITFHLRLAVADFNLVTTLPAFAPFKKSQDRGAKSDFRVFSDGPYRLQGRWAERKGGTFVRNKKYNPRTDDQNIRRALPDRFVFVEGQNTAKLYDRLLADSGRDRYLVTDRTAPPSDLRRVEAQRARYTDSASPFVDYLAPNFTTLGADNRHGAAIRKALAVSTNRKAYLAAEGDPAVASGAYGIVLPSLGAAGGYREFKAFDVPDTGDPALAKRILEAAGVKLPYPIHVLYPGDSRTQDEQVAALARTWGRAGFKVDTSTLLSPGIVEDPHVAARWQVTIGGWAADWPDASAVLPPMFDSRVNLTKDGNGYDIGWYDSARTNAAIDAAEDTADPTSRANQWADLDEALAKEVAYIPLDNPRFPRLHGSKVTDYVESASTGGYPDLGQLGARSQA